MLKKLKLAVKDARAARAAVDVAAAARAVAWADPLAPLAWRDLAADHAAAQDKARAADAKVHKILVKMISRYE